MPTMCRKLEKKINFEVQSAAGSSVKKTIKYDDTKLMLIADGISGIIIDSLVVNLEYQSTTQGMLIDMMLIDLSQGKTKSEAINIVDTIWATVVNWQTNLQKYEICILCKNYQNGIFLVYPCIF